MTIAQRLAAGQYRLLDSKEAAVSLKIKPSRLRTWVKSNEIPYLRIGRSIRFDPEQLAEWIEARQESRGYVRK